MVILLIASIPLSLKQSIPQIQICHLQYLDLHPEIDSEGRLGKKLYIKKDYFNFPIVIFPFICSNIPAAPAYGVYIYI